MRTNTDNKNKSLQKYCIKIHWNKLLGAELKLERIIIPGHQFFYRPATKISRAT